MLIGFSARSWAGRLALAGALLAPLAAAPPLALADPAPTDKQVRSVECKGGALVAGYVQNPTAEISESDDESVTDEQQPAIHGTWSLPGTNEDDSNAIAAALPAKYPGASPIPPDQAIVFAQAALSDASQRKFKRPNLELENTVVIWSVETTKSSGSNKSLEVKLDAANGNILSVECD